jgi:hypothetical protein
MLMPDDYYGKLAGAGLKPFLALADRVLRVFDPSLWGQSEFFSAPLTSLVHSPIMTM